MNMQGGACRFEAQLQIRFIFAPQSYSLAGDVTQASASDWYPRHFTRNYVL